MTGPDEDDAGSGQPQPAGTQRLDKWLWFARIVKSRTQAAQLVLDGKVRVNRAKVAKPSHTVRPGDVLTIALRGNIGVIRVLAPGTRRGPPPEARLLYEALAPLTGTTSPHAGGMPPRERGTGRPTKRDRRLIERLTEQDN